MATKATAPKAAPKPKKERKTGICLFSGEVTGGGNFRPGYDAKMKGLLLGVMRGQRKLNEVRKEALPLLKSESGLVGFRLVNGQLQVVGKFAVAENRPKKVPAKKEAVSKAKAAKAKIAKRPESDDTPVFVED